MSNDHTPTSPVRTGAGPKPRMLTLAEANSLESDDEHYDSTKDNMAAIIGMSEHLRCWRQETIPVPKIDPFQLIDDSNDHDGEAKVE